MPSTAVEQFLRHLQNVKPSGNGWSARCSVHEDHQSSLSISEGRDGRVLVKCFAGCAVEQVLAALKLEMRHLFPERRPQQPAANSRRRVPLTVEELARDKALPADFLRSLGLEDRHDGVLIAYKMVDGSPASRQRLRTALKAKDGSLWLPGEGPPVPYGLWRLSEAQGGGYLIVPEGESDCCTAWFHGFPALGLPGATTSSLLQASHLHGVDRLYLFKEPDKAGPKFISGLTKRLREIEWHGIALVITPPPGVKDINDLHKRDPAAFKTTFQELIRSATPLEAGRGEPVPVLICMADVDPVPVSWLWEPYVPLGKLTIVEGDPGIGKTQVAIAMSAQVSLGLPLPSPDGTGGPSRAPASVIYMTAEDGLADTIRPRLDAAGADVSRIYILQAKETRDGNGIPVRRGISLADISVIEKALALLRPLLLVVDPLQAYLGSDVDMYRPNETRPLLAALAQLAEKFGCAVILIRHLTKDERTKPLYRGMGSIDITASARSVLLAGQDPRHPDRRAVIHIKSSLAKLGPSLGYELRETGLAWTGATDLTAAAVMAAQETPEQRSALDEAVEFLKTTLSDGPRLSKEVLKSAHKAGIAEPTLRRAQFVAGVHCRRRSEVGAGRGDGDWEWYLATRSDTAAPQAPLNDHLEDPLKPVDRTELPSVVQDDQMITLTDQVNPPEPQEVTVHVQDDHGGGQGTVVGDPGDDDSELF